VHITRSSRIAATVLGFGLLASACAGGRAPDTAEANAAGEAAAANIDDLSAAESVFDYEVLDVSSGAISNVRTAVTGDRPVLLWFYSPH